MADESPTIKKLDTLEALLKKKYGDNYYGIKGENKIPPIQWTSTGVYALDYVFGKGIPQGKILQILGWESCGNNNNLLRFYIV